MNNSKYVLTEPRPQKQKMNPNKAYLLISSLMILLFSSAVFTADLNRTVTISSNEKFELLGDDEITFELKPLPGHASALETTRNASSLGITYLGQLKLRNNTTALSALHSIANQIGTSLDLRFAVVIDSNTSEALKTNQQLLLYHPDTIITLSLLKPAEQDHYEFVCTYVVRKTEVQNPDSYNLLKSAPTLSSKDAQAPSMPNVHGFN